MKIERTRYVVIRKEDGYIFCGVAKNYDFKDPNDLGDTPFKTFPSEAKAIDGFKRSYGDICAIEVKKVIESLVEV